MLDGDGTAPGVVAVVLVRGDGRHAHGGERGDRGYSDTRSVDAKPGEHQMSSVGPSGYCVKTEARLEPSGGPSIY